MNCPKCGKEMSLYQHNVIDCGGSVVVFFRCESCWITYNVSFSNPICCDGYEDPLRLEAMYGDERYKYYKCSKPGNDNYTNVASRGKYVNKARLEEMGFKVVADPDEGITLPAWRLYELK